MIRQRGGHQIPAGIREADQICAAAYLRRNAFDETAPAKAIHQTHHVAFGNSQFISQFLLIQVSPKPSSIASKSNCASVSLCFLSESSTLDCSVQNVRIICSQVSNSKREWNFPINYRAVHG